MYKRISRLLAVSVPAAGLALSLMGVSAGASTASHLAMRADGITPNTNATLGHGAWNPGGLNLASAKVKLVYQFDGNLVLYCRSNNKAVWASNTDGATNHATLHFQSDGNLVIYNNGRAIWASNTDGNPQDWGVVQDDSNFVIYRAAGNAAWATNTSGRC